MNEEDSEKKSSRPVEDWAVPRTDTRGVTGQLERVGTHYGFVLF